MYAHKFETLASTDQESQWYKRKFINVESETIIKSMEKRINKYLHKQKKIEFDGYKTARNIHQDKLREIPSK